MIEKRRSSHEREVLQLKSDYEKMKQELNCLLFLVKQTWTGNRNASKELARIVGVAPPDIVVDSSGSENKVFMCVTKQNTAILNWTRLTMRLINRHLRSEEVASNERQKEYFNDRLDMLDSELRGTTKPYRSKSANPYSKPSKPLAITPATPFQNEVYDLEQTITPSPPSSKENEHKIASQSIIKHESLTPDEAVFNEEDESVAKLFQIKGKSYHHTSIYDPSVALNSNPKQSFNRKTKIRPRTANVTFNSEVETSDASTTHSAKTTTNQTVASAKKSQIVSKRPMSSAVKYGCPGDEFLHENLNQEFSDLREMEDEFRKKTISLQKRIGVISAGYVS